MTIFRASSLLEILCVLLESEEIAKQIESSENSRISQRPSLSCNMSPSLNLQSRVKLNDGAEIPRLGLGVYEMTDEET
jgi:hypothetical protein